MKMEKVGLVGVGQMGLPMGKNLLRAGYAVPIFARRREAANPLLALGATFSDSPAQLMEESEFVLLCLPTPNDVRQVIFGNHGLAYGLNIRGKVVIDSSTIDPGSTREIARRLRSLGIEYLDAPVSGGPEGASNATLTFMVGGKRDAFEKTSGLFRSMGKNVFYLGESGAGTGAKLVNQLLVASNTLAAAEAMQLSQALGLDRKQVIEVIKTSAGDSFAFRRVAPKIANSDFGSGWQTYLLEKDLRLLLETSDALGLPSISVKSAHEIFSKSLERGLGNVDSASVIQVLKEMKKPKEKS